MKRALFLIRGFILDNSKIEPYQKIRDKSHRNKSQSRTLYLLPDHQSRSLSNESSTKQRTGIELLYDCFWRGVYDHGFSSDNKR